MTPLRLLIVSNTLPRPDHNAGDRRLMAMLRMLAKRHRVDFVVPAGPGARSEAGLEELRHAGVVLRGFGWSALRGALASGPYHAAIFEFYAPFETYGAHVREAQPSAALIIDTVDVHFARESAGASLGVVDGRAAQEHKARELRADPAADGLIVVTADDAQVLLEEKIECRLFTIPIVLPLRVRPRLRRGANVLFIGGFAHAPNVDAVNWFAREVWPEVLAVRPEAVFQIVGSNAPHEVLELGGLPGIQVVGYVPDTAPYLDAASVSVAPLRYGAGMKGKVNEALASGLPVVTTSFGVQGIPVQSGVHAYVHDDAAGFAGAVVALLADPAAAEVLGAAGQQIAAQFSPDAVAKALNRMLEELAPRPRALSRWLWWGIAAGRIALRAAVHAVRSPRSSGRSTQ